MATKAAVCLHATHEKCIQAIGKACSAAACKGYNHDAYTQLGNTLLRVAFYLCIMHPDEACGRFGFAPVLQPYQQAIVLILPVKGRFWFFKWRLRCCIPLFDIQQGIVMQYDASHTLRKGRFMQ